MRPNGTKQSIASGALASFLGQLATYGFALTGTLLVARALGPEGRGEMAVAITAATSFFAVSHLSIDLSATYFFARRLLSLDMIGRVMATVALVMAPVALLLQLGFFLATRDSVFAGVDSTAVLIAAATVPVTIHLVWLIALFQLGERLVRSQAASVTSAALQLTGVGILAVTNRLTLTTAMLLYAGNATCTWLLHVLWGRSFLSLKPTRNFSAVRAMAGYALRLHPGYLFWFLLLRADILLVNALLGTREAGLYSIAVIVAEMILLLSAPIAVAVLPVQSLHEGAAAASLTFKAVRFNLLLAACLALGFAVTMPFLIPLVFGPSFGSSYGAMLALLPGVVAMAGYRPLYNWLLKQGRPGRATAICAAAFGANLVLNLVLLPSLGTVGAGVASSLAYTGLTVTFLAWGLRVAGATLGEALRPRREDLDSIRRFARVLDRRER